MPTIRSTSAPTAAVSTSSRAHPQVRLLLGLRCMSTAVTVEAISTDMSVSSVAGVDQQRQRSGDDGADHFGDEHRGSQPQ